MQQHPIPHNVLDIEYKLIGSLTIKQFAYIGTGVGIGGLFLYGFATNPKAMPAWIAFPAFLIFASIGGFMILKIGNQTGDIFLRNFIRAITRPTRRVWKSKNFEEKVDEILAKRQKTYASENVNSVGITQKHISDQPLDEEETKRLEQISKEANSILNPNSNNQSVITITNENLNLFHTDINLDPNKLGSLTFFVVNKEGQPAPNTKIQVLNTQNNENVYNGITNQYGLATTQILPSGKYKISFSNQQNQYPQFIISIENNKIPTIKIKPL